MNDRDTPAPSATRARPATGGYSERLYVPWWGWPVPLAIAVLLAAEIHMGYPGVRAWLPYLVTIPIGIALMLWLGRVKVSVEDGELWVGDAHLPVQFMGELTPLTGKQKRPVLGRDLDPAAFVVHRGWIGPVLHVELRDPDDPTPYWVISTRNPDKLVAALRECRDGQPADSPTGEQ